MLNGESVPESRLREIYDEVAKAHPAILNHGYGPFVGFLTGQGLAAAPPNAQYEITEKGRAFLTYLAYVGKPMHRPF